MTRRTTLVLGVLAGVITTALIGGIAWAAIPGPGGVIQGCYDGGGNLRVVEALPCPKNFKPLAWNQQGVPGTNGTNGTDGTNGTNGLTSTYIRRWFPSGADLGPDNLLTTAESVTTTLECDDLNDQITGAGVAGASWQDQNPPPEVGILATSAQPFEGDGSTTRDRANLRITNDMAPLNFFFPGSGWIICASVD